MSTLRLTDNTTLDVTASPAGADATLNRYFPEALTFQTAAELPSLAGKTVADLDAKHFPIQATATVAAKAMVEGTSVGLTAAGSASVNVLKADAVADLLGSLQIPRDPAVAALISFGLQGQVTAAPNAKTGNLCFGIADSATVSLTSFCPTSASETFGTALQRSIAALTIPHDLADLKSIPAGAICQIDAAGCLKFSASVSYSVLNNPLATVPIPHLPAVAVNASAGATLEATATHISDHTITIARLANGLLHLSLSLARTDDFETSLTASAGVAVNVGDKDALSFLLDRISPKSEAEMAKIKAAMPESARDQLAGDIKAALDASMCSSLQASLKLALDNSLCKNRMFLYEIDLDKLDSAGRAALQAALAGDFTRLTSRSAAFSGIHELDSALTVTSKVKHNLTVHLLGIFNYQSTEAFIKKSKIDYTKDTHELVISDESVQVVGNNLAAEKLREVVAKAVTLTLPASANTPEAKTPLKLLFFDRHGSTSPSDMRQFVNVLRMIGAPAADAANSLIVKNLKHYGPSSLFLGLDVTPPQCRQLFIDKTGRPRDWTTFLEYACDAQRSILAGDPDQINQERLKLFGAGLNYWRRLNTAGAAPNRIRILAEQGIAQAALVDVVALLWWSFSMESYARALAHGESLVDAGIELVKDSNGGFNEPWLMVAMWNLLENPALQSQFTCPALPRAAGANS